MDDVVTSSYINDVLRIELSFDMPVPDWVTADVLKQLDEVHKIANELLGLTRRIQKLRIGVFLQDLTKKIEQTIRNPTDPGLKKLNVYSTVRF